MEPREAELAAIGEAIRAALDADCAASNDIREARSRVIREVTRPKANGWPARAWRWVGWHPRIARCTAAALATGLITAGVGLWMQMPISFEVDRADAVGQAGEAGEVGDAIEALGQVPVALRFSEGSAIVLEQGGRARVLSAESAGARVLLEAGTAEASIRHRAGHGTRWTFDAGPFRVQVVGTRFRLTWDEDEQSFHLLAREGLVMVAGGCLGTGRPVRAGEQVDVTCPSGSEPNARAVGADGERDHRTEDTSTDSEGPRRDGAAEPLTVAAGGARPSPPWQELLHAGRLDRAYRAAERGNFEQICRAAAAPDLIALADGARLAKRIDRATRALLAVRQRFSGTSDAAMAAFALGRIAFDTRGAFAEATQWFRAYLREDPKGPLMGDAVGRLMESRWRQADRAGARADARRYLVRFPGGPYASRARQILAE